MAIAVLAPPANTSSSHYLNPNHNHITVSPSLAPSSSRSPMPSSSSPPKTDSPDPPQRALHRLRSSLRLPTMKSSSPSSNPAQGESAKVVDKKGKARAKASGNVTAKETKERDKPSMLRRIESNLPFRRAVPLPSPTSPVRLSPTIGKTKDDGKQTPEVRHSGAPGFTAPSLRQATMSSPALHLASQAIPSPRSRPAVAATSSSGTDAIVSPGRGRRASLQPSSPEVNASLVSAPRRSSNDNARPSKPSLTSPSAPSLSSTLRRSPHTPETRRVREPQSPPGTPTPMPHRRQASALSSQRAASSSSTHLPIGTPPSSPTAATPTQPNSALRTRSVTPTTVRAPPSSFTRSSVSPTARRGSLEQRRVSDTPPPASPSSIRPRAAAPNYPHNRQFNVSSASISASPDLERRESIRSAVLILCRELAKPPSHLSRSSGGAREWEDIEARIRPLVRSQRLWRNNGGIASGSSSQVNLSGNTGSTLGTDERERKCFSEVLRDGYVLCQLYNKLRSAAVLRPDPRDDGFTRTSNVAKFLTACSSFGVPSDSLFLPDDLIQSTPESLARVAGTISALSQHSEAPGLDPSNYLRGQAKNASAAAAAASVYTYGRSRAAASTPNLSLGQVRGALSTRAQSPPIQIKRPSPDLSVVHSESHSGSSGSSGQTVEDGSRDRKTPRPGSDAANNNNNSKVGLRAMSPPPRSPLRARPLPGHTNDPDGVILSSSLPNVFTPPERISVADSTRAEPGNSVRASIADTRKAARQSVASSSVTDTTAFSSVFDVRRHSGGGLNKFGTIRSVTTEQTDPPSLSRAEGSSIAAAFVPDEKGRKRGMVGDRKQSDPPVVDLSRVAEEAEEGVGGPSAHGTAKGIALERTESRVEKAHVSRLGKGKLPDEFRDVQAQPSRPIPIKQCTPADRDEVYSETPMSVTPPSQSGARKLAIVGRRNESVESLQQFPRRPTHRALHSIDTSCALAPRDPAIRDSSPDNLSSSRLVLRRASSNKPSPRRTGVYIPRNLDDRGPTRDQSTDSLLPFPRAASGERTANSASPAPSSDARRGTDSPLPIDKPRLPRGRFQSEIDGVSARRRGRPYSYDELGARPAQRSRYESMVNLGVASGNPSASDYMSRESLDGGGIRKTLVIREEGKPPIHFQLGNCIGRGQFGSVYRALNMDSGQMVAVKRIRLEGLKEEEVTQLMREVDLVKRLSHPSIVKYEGMARDEDTLSIILEFAENGSLGQTLKAFGKFPEHLVAIYVVKILEGLHYLHESDVVHCDLKAANILTTKNGNVKLSDFGVSLNLRAMERDMKDVAGTPNWMAPEVIELKGASPKSDIWSLGCTVIELLTGRPPYSDIANSMSVMFHIVEDEMPPIPEGCSDSLRDFLKRCFFKNPKRRPTAELLCEHPWLKDNWGAHKDLRPQDSIPFLRRVSADLQKNELARYWLQFDMNDSPSSEAPPRIDDIVSASPPKVSLISNALPASLLPPDNNAISPREHNFVKTTFSKPMLCRVCSIHAKKTAVLCAQCSLIAHSKCARDAPPTCDLRAQLLLYARYAEQGNPASVYSNPMDNAEGGVPGPRPTGPMSDVPYISRSPRTSVDAPNPSPMPPSRPRPQKANSAPLQPSSGHKFISVFKRYRVVSPELAQPSTPVPPPPPPRETPDSKEVTQRPKVLKRTKEQSASSACSTATPNSYRSIATVSDSVSSRNAPEKSDPGTQTSGSRFSVVADSDMAEIPRPSSNPAQRMTTPGNSNQNSKKHHSRPGCTVQ